MTVETETSALIFVGTAEENLGSRKDILLTGDNILIIAVDDSNLIQRRIKEMITGVRP